MTSNLYIYFEACESNNNKKNLRDWTTLEALRCWADCEFPDSLSYEEIYGKTPDYIYGILLKNLDNQLTLSKIGLGTVLIDGDRRVITTAKTIYDIFGEMETDLAKRTVKSIIRWVLSRNIEIREAEGNTICSKYENQIEDLGSENADIENDIVSVELESLIILDILLGLLNEDNLDKFLAISQKLNIGFCSDKAISDSLFGLQYAFIVQIQSKMDELNIFEKNWQSEFDKFKEEHNASMEYILLNEKTGVNNRLDELDKKHESIEKTVGNYTEEKLRGIIAKTEDRLQIRVIELAVLLIAVFSIIGVNIFSTRNIIWDGRTLVKINITLAVSLFLLFGFMLIYRYIDFRKDKKE
ncbi:MAG: hypothetical protein FWE24_09765 [Defluviitaleaceae bacterium]|nr:hypothetical protein [Defluviitaleaceae bacterium]